MTYFRATPDAHLNPFGASTGSFYALVLENPQIAPGYCNAGLKVMKGVNGVVTQLADGTAGCRDGMTLRIVVRNHMIYIFNDEWNGCCFYIGDRDLMTGRAGAGAAISLLGTGSTGWG